MLSQLKGTIIRQKNRFFLILYGFFFYLFLSSFFNLSLSIPILFGQQKFLNIWKPLTVFLRHFTQGGLVMFILRLWFLLAGIGLLFFFFGLIFFPAIHELFSETVVDFDKNKIKFRTLFKSFLFDKSEIDCWEVSFTGVGFGISSNLKIPYVNLLFNDGRFFSFKLPMTYRQSDSIIYGELLNSFFGTKENWSEGKKIEFQEKLSLQRGLMQRLKIDFKGYCWIEGK